MRSALLAACALLACVPACWAEEAAATKPETVLRLGDVVADKTIIHCEGLRPAYLVFAEDSAGLLELDAWPLHKKVVQLGDRVVVERKGTYYVISESEVVELSAAGSKIYSCEKLGIDFLMLLSNLLEEAQ
ncbi:hypothetical protein P2H44_06530 [Albimonas sp. CAU 1670]|uniref:hypothetical protein n=1 Tax=Albimonas sp. CAU 1670 TaxID=3032599 RepID=UPI0023D9BB87|nr:hypothetical protein [Albimonas sp. CAU 1670]MDF2232206.1 hypothetical protein [Albimonas sp. CAU 1670]